MSNSILVGERTITGPTKVVRRYRNTILAGLVYKPIGKRRAVPWNQENYSLAYLLHGYGRYRDEKTTRDLKPGCVFQRLPGMQHVVELYPDCIPYQISLGVPREVYDVLEGLGTISRDAPVLESGVH